MPTEASKAELRPERAYEQARTRRLHLLFSALLCVIALAVYSNSFRCGLVLDSRPLILDDVRTHQLTRHSLQAIFTQPYWPNIPTSGLYRPVTTLSYLFDYAVLGNQANPAGYHWVNLLLHGLNTILLYRLAYHLTGKCGAALATAALWTVHPVLTESVTNVIGRADLLCGAALLGGLLLHIHGAERAGWYAKTWWLGGLALLTVLGILSKESAIVFPALMLIYDVRFRNPARRVWLAGYAAVLPALSLCWWVHQKLVPAPLHPVVDNPLAGASYWTAKLTAVKVTGKYLWLLLFPRHLSYDYSFNQIPLVTWHFDRWQDAQALVAAAACAVILAAAIFSYRRSGVVFFWIALAVVTFLPTSNLFVAIGSIMAERFLYLPAMGFAACLVAGFRVAGGRLRMPGLTAAGVGLLCLLFGYRTISRNFDWESDGALASSGVTTSPNSFKTHWALASYLSQRGPAELDRAILEIERSIRIQDSLPEAQRAAITFSLAGQLYRVKGDLTRTKTGEASAIPWYRESRDVLLRGVGVDRLKNAEFRAHEMRHGARPGMIRQFGISGVYLQLGRTYLELHEPNRALEMAMYGRKLVPADPDFFGLLVNTYAAMHDYERQAITLLEFARMFPQDPRVGQILPGALAHIDMKGCQPLIASQWQVDLNLSCPENQRMACTARENLVQLMLDAREEQQARAFWKEGQAMNCLMRKFDFEGK